LLADVKMPVALQGMFKPSRYKIAHGGRGSGKSWGFARALLMRGASQKLRILCAREVQKSIKQSVHTLLSDQIQELGLGADYQVLETEIRGINGTSITFAGLATHTVESIKSYEGADIVWVEEAQTVSKKSWDILIPTIRKPDSEIWVTFNPDLDSDDTFIRFVENPPEGAFVIKMNYTENPWFPDVLEKERLHSFKNDPEGYMNIWEGACKSAVDGAIYAGEITKAQLDGHICNVPYDPQLKVHVVFDLGWNDSMFISLIQKGVADIRVIEAIQDDHKTLDYYSALLKTKLYNWGTVYLPHDGASKDFKTGRSSQDFMQEYGWDVEIVPQIGIEEGIKLARVMFSRCYFDKTHSKSLVDSLKRYRRIINTRSNEPDKPLHDNASHGADNFRYIAVAADLMRNENYGKPLDRSVNRSNWRT